MFRMAAGEIILISIHAPVKGATHPGGGLPRGDRISIHAPVKGATIGLAVTLRCALISIHAPVKGAT